MQPWFTSKTHGQASIVNMVAKVKDGEVRPGLSYIDSLRGFLAQVDARINDVDPWDLDLSDPDTTVEFDRVTSLQFTTLTTFRIGHDHYLLFSVIFDGLVDDYFTETINNFGELIDALWRHTEGYPGMSDMTEFARFQREHEIGTAVFHAQNPFITAPDIRNARRPQKRP